MVDLITGIITLFSQVLFGQFVALAFVIITACFVLIYSLSHKVIYINKMNVSMLFLWLLIMISLTRIENLFYVESIIELSWLTLGFIFIFLSLLNFKTDIYQYRKYISLATLSFSPIVLVGYVFNSDCFGLINYPYAGTRVVGGFDGPNEIAGYYLMVLGLMLGWYYFDHLKSHKALVWMNIFTAIVIIVLSWSRSGLLGLALILLFFLIYFMWSNLKGVKIVRLLFNLVVGSFLILMMLYHVYPSLKIVRQNSSSRMPLISESVRLIKQKPFFGHGIGGFAIYGELKNSTPHNGPLFLLVSGGIVSFLLFFLFFGSLTVICLKKGLYPEFFFLMLFLYQEMFFNNLIRGRLSFLFWICTLYILKYKSSRPNAEVVSASKKVFN